MIRTPKPKTKRARRALEKKAPKIVENPKSALFIRGQNTSAIVISALTDLYRLKKPDAALLKKKNPILPFEDASGLEFLSQKNDASLFVLATHSKKRPHNLTFGRTFDYHLLDLLEVGITQYKPLSEFKNVKCSAGGKHTFLFNGEIFEQKEEFKMFKNYMLDFYRGEQITSLDLAGLDHVVSISASQEGKIYLRVYMVSLKKSGTRLPRIELEEMGPSIDLEIRRVKPPAPEVLREALKVPRTLKPKKVKNVSTDMLGKKYGRIHMEKQDLDKMALRKMKGLKRTRQEKSEEEPSQKRVKEE